MIIINEMMIRYIIIHYHILMRVGNRGDDGNDDDEYEYDDDDDDGDEERK
jgi:hypothetical protein